MVRLAQMLGCVLLSCAVMFLVGADSNRFGDIVADSITVQDIRIVDTDGQEVGRIRDGKLVLRRTADEAALLLLVPPKADDAVMIMMKQNGNTLLLTPTERSAVAVLHDHKTVYSSP